MNALISGYFGVGGLPQSFSILLLLNFQIFVKKCAFFLSPGKARENFNSESQGTGYPREMLLHS